MSRNGSGTYSLPAGNPVVPNTTISSTVQNATMADLATEMTDSLNRSGKGGMLAPFKAADGTVAAPSITFGSDVDTGFYHLSADTLALAANGIKSMEWTSQGPMLKAGTAGAPSLAFADDPDTGVYLPGIGGGGLSAAGTLVVSWGASGLSVTGGLSGTLLGGSSVALGITSTSSGTAALLNNAGGTGYTLSLQGNTTRSALRMVPQSAPTVGQVGDLYVSSADNKLYICTVAGSPGTWVVVGTQS